MTLTRGGGVEEGGGGEWRRGEGGRVSVKKSIVQRKEGGQFNQKLINVNYELPLEFNVLGQSNYRIP